MNGKNLIRVAREQGWKTLSEMESREVLKQYRVPVVEAEIVAHIEEVVPHAEVIGYPLVLKAYGRKLLHKTERGLVRLDLRDAEDVLNAAIEIKEAAGNEFEGFLIQPMVKGRREFMAGMFRDADFGPVIMFGLGGIFAEALGDVVFRVAPLDEMHARQMIREIRSSKLLGKFRGEEPAQEEQIIRTLMGLSQLSIEYPEVKEIDVNPLLVSTDGRVAALDALIVLDDMLSEEIPPRTLDPEIWRDFLAPRSIAFIGASSRFGKWGYTLLTNVLAGKFKGDVYPVNPSGGEIAGKPVYTSLHALPGPVDLAVVSIPAGRVFDVIPELKKKGIKRVLMVTSGFGETGPEGRRREAELVAECRKSGISIIGPNTMGICNPHENFFCTYQHVRPASGSTAIVSQSGNLGTQLLAFAEGERIGIRAFLGSGNEAMVTVEDYLEFLERDDLTKTVVLYMESVKNGRRFYKTARRVSRKKPIILLKGGRTQEGGRAAASHTGALASDVRIFEAVCRQAGIVMGEKTMDLLDFSAAFSSLPLPRGGRVAIMTLGGGWGVVTTDVCVEYGLEVPQLSRDLIERFSKILPDFWSRANPVDLVAEMDLAVPLKLVEELVKWEGCDAVIHLGILGRKTFVKGMIESARTVDALCDAGMLEKLPRRLEEYDLEFTTHVVKLMERYEKPIVGVRLTAEGVTGTVTDVEGYRYKGVSFLTPERAAKVLAGMYFYRKWLDLEGVSMEER